MNSSCTVAGFIGALAALRRHCSLLACCGIKSRDNKVNGHDLNSMPGSTAGEMSLQCVKQIVEQYSGCKCL